MGVYRHVQTAIWHDPFFFSLSTRDKVFFLYLISNGNTTQCGIFEHSTAMMAMDLHYNERVVKEQVQWFINQGKLKHDPGTNEFFVVSWLTYHYSLSPSVQTKIKSELAKVKSPDLLLFWTQCAHSVDTVSVKEKEKEKRKEKVKEKKKEKKEEVGVTEEKKSKKDETTNQTKEQKAREDLVKQPDPGSNDQSGQKLPKPLFFPDLSPNEPKNEHEDQQQKQLQTQSQLQMQTQTQTQPQPQTQPQLRDLGGNSPPNLLTLPPTQPNSQQDCDARREEKPPGSGSPPFLPTPPPTGATRSFAGRDNPPRSRILLSGCQEDKAWRILKTI